MQAHAPGACGLGAVATADCVPGSRHAVGDTGASTGDAGVASGVGNLGGWLGNQDRWQVWHAATGLFARAGRPCWSRNVASSPGDSAARDIGNGHSEWCGSWLPPARSRPSQKTAFTGRIRTTTKVDAEGDTRYRDARSGEEKLRGQFSERCPWFTFPPMILADFLTDDNIQTDESWDVHPTVGKLLYRSIVDETYVPSQD